MPPLKAGEDPEIHALLKRYVDAKNSNPPPPTSEAETKLVRALVGKMESLERTRQDLARQLGSSIRESGTFAPLGQDQVDNMLLRAEIAKLQKENADLKEVIKVWTNRKNDWVIRLLMGIIFAGAIFIWKIISERK